MPSKSGQNISGQAKGLPLKHTKAQTTPAWELAFITLQHVSVPAWDQAALALQPAHPMKY